MHLLRDSGKTNAGFACKYAAERIRALLHLKAPLERVGGGVGRGEGGLGWREGWVGIPTPTGPENLEFFGQPRNAPNQEPPTVILSCTIGGAKFQDFFENLWRQKGRGT